LDRSVEFILNPADRTEILKRRPDSFIVEMRRIFGERPNGTKHDVLKLALDAKQNGSLPKLWIDCGTEDYLIEGTRAFHCELQAAQVPHVYHEFSGTHGWDYCNQHIDAAFEFHAANLNIAPTPSK
jgi:putative tributyrin esterase